MEQVEKTALVTGAGKGIGKAIALAFAQAGYNVIINYNGSKEAAQSVLKEAESYGVKAITIQADVSKDEQVKAMIDQAMEQFGRIDVLVNNSGINKDGLMMRMSLEDFHKVIAVNLEGTFNCIKHVSRQMLKQRGGRIINISSVSGVMGNAGQANYCASKAGIIGLTKSVARELGSRGITSNAVAPGFIRTEMTDVLPEDVKKAMGEQIPLKHFGETKDIAEAVAFLASDEAAYITGQVLHVDGGMAM